MLKIVEHTPTRLVLREQRIPAAILAGVFILLSLISLAMVFVQSISVIFTPIEGEANFMRIVAFLIFMLVVASFALLGLLAMVQFIRGTTCTFDKIEGIMTLENPSFLRIKRETLSIYGISHLDIETNTSVRAYGLFIVLRSGERIPLTAVPIMERDHLENLKVTIRTFLQ